ncbi:hypothetical protein [Paraburkholderia sp. Ac-20347]|uniref:hypothetical protein n=1 Tax=Paraburkholderia sp. Ac-20347 TaxID=2703892 RepID=UPI00197F455D|nr:hypothetical protein [Paraburkholderia sp. Ac-20347]MBN3809759.1 hypothetical protein [Paraburkholderia sp. Ac-20347]
MRKRLPPSALSLLLLVSSVAHSQQPPAYAECAAAVQARHGAARLSFDSISRPYRTVIAQASRGPVNFAGRYILVQWGCGAGCVMAAAIDTRSGRVTSLPFNVSDWPLDVTEPLAFRADSCLLVVRGSRNERAEHGTYYYMFDGKVFRLRASRMEAKR